MMWFLSFFRRSKLQKEMFDYISKLILASSTQEDIKKIVKKISDEEKNKNLTTTMADDLTHMWKEKGLKK